MRILSVLLVLCIHLRSQNYFHIPDPVFAAHLGTTIPAAISGQSLDISHSLVTVYTKTITLYKLPVKNLEGIQHFTSLRMLSCNYCNDLLNIPSLPTSLRFFNFNYGKAPSLPSMPDSLESLGLVSCSLSVLPKLNMSLKELVCIANSVTILYLPPSLEKLNCNLCGLQSLPALPHTLKELSCAGNLLSSLPQLPPGLKTLICSGNISITTLPALPQGLSSLYYESCPTRNIKNLPASLRYLNCNSTLTDTIDIIPAALEHLYASNNNLTTLPSLPSGLRVLNCANNQISHIPPLPDSLEHFTCSNNQLKNMPRLPDALKTLDCGGNQITCFTEFPCCLWPPGSKHGPYSIDLLPNPFSCLPRYSYAMPPSYKQYPLCTDNQLEDCKSITSTGEILLFRVKCYPNPANDVIFIETPDGLSSDVQIIDITGRQVITEKEVTGRISVKQLPEGLYTVTVTHDHQRKYQRILIEHE